MAQGRYYNSELVKDVYVVNPVTAAITASGTTTNDALLLELQPMMLSIGSGFQILLLYLILLIAM
jgi:hypothetical protein